MATPVSESSDFRAIASGIPFIGSFFAYYNWTELESEWPFVSNRPLNALTAPLADLLQNHQRGAQTAQLLGGRFFMFLSKAEYYCRAAGHGCLISVIAAVALLALEILSFLPAMLMIAGYAFLGMSWAFCQGEFQFSCSMLLETGLY